MKLSVIKNDANAYFFELDGLVPAQDIQFTLIIWYVAKKTYFVGIKPLFK